MNKRKFLMGFLFVAVFALMAYPAFAVDGVDYDDQNDENAVAFLNSENETSLKYADNWVASKDYDFSEYHAVRFWYDPNIGTNETDPADFKARDVDSALWYLGADHKLYVDEGAGSKDFQIAFFRGGLGLERKYVTVSDDASLLPDWGMRFWYGLEGIDADADKTKGFDFDADFGVLTYDTSQPGSILFSPCCDKHEWCCLDVNRDYLLISSDASYDYGELYSSDWADRWPLSSDTDELEEPWYVNDGALASVDVMVYIPCYDAEKRWQLHPYDKRVHFDDMVLVNPAELLEADPDETCVLGYTGDKVDTLFSTHFLYLGPYVVEKNVTLPSDSAKLNKSASSDYLTERVLNFSPFGLVPPTQLLQHPFDWHRVVETFWNISVDQQAIAERQTLAEICDNPEVKDNTQKAVSDVALSYLYGDELLASGDAYRARKIASNDTVGNYDGIFAQYLLYQDDAANHGEWKGVKDDYFSTYWYSYISELHSSLYDFALSPGFAQYLAVLPGYESDECNWDKDGGFKSPWIVNDDVSGQAARYHMFYWLYGQDKNEPAGYDEFCEFTEIGYRHWEEDKLCSQICKGDTVLDDDECWIYTPMSVDTATWNEMYALAVSTDGIDISNGIDTFGLDGGDCDYVCGGEIGWYHDDQAKNIKTVIEAEGAHVCLETEFGLQVSEYNCNPATGILPLKLEFLLREGQVCCPEIKTVIKNQLALLGAKRVCDVAPKTYTYVDDNGEKHAIAEVANMGPVDAFLSKGTNALAEGEPELLQIIFRGVDGVNYDLVEIAEDHFAAEKETYPWLGKKNFFRVWPQTLVSGDVTDFEYDHEMLSVKEAWLAGEQVEFSFYAIFVDGNPDDGVYVKAEDGYFVIYTGATEANAEVRLIDGKVAVACNWAGGAAPTPEPKDPEIVSITSDPQGSVTEANCASDDELTKDSFSDAAWTEILAALNISADDEGDYEYTVTCKDCDDYVVSLDAEASLDVKVTYEEGEPAPAAGTYRSVFVKDVVNSLYDVLAAEELTIAVEKDVQGVIYEGGAYDADASEDTLKAGFCLLQVVATEKTETPTPVPSGSGGGSGCSFGFAPLALLLLAPLALLKK